LKPRPHYSHLESRSTPMDRCMGVTQRRSGLFGEQKVLFSLLGFEPRIENTITRLRAGRSRKLVGLRAEVRNFPLLRHIQSGYGAKTTLSTAEVKNEWTYTTTPIRLYSLQRYYLIAVCRQYLRIILGIYQKP
jgi:hypothetical protein